MEKVKTTKIQGGAEYAKVSDRLKVFRSENPRALIETTPLLQESGMMMFRTRILKDKADPNSAEATGHALQTKEGVKDFEKLETISVGRALALIGYAADGEIASSEEMEDYEEFKEDKRVNQVFELSERIKNAKNIKELAEVWASIDGSFKKEVEEIKNKRKQELQNENTKVPRQRRVATSPKVQDNGVEAEGHSN